MGNPRRIEVDHAAVNEHVASISGHSSSFDVTISPVTGGTATAIGEADGLGGDFSRLSGSYASALPNSANNISIIAEVLRTVDIESKETFS